MKRPQKTAAQLRRANRGNVPGHLDMAALSALTGRADTVSKPHCRVEPKPPNPIHAAYCKCEGCQR